MLMAGPGSQKFTSPTWERMFRTWGYPDGFYLVIGAVEVIGGIALLIPRVASYSAIMLAIVMIGAAATQILRGGRNGVGEIVFARVAVRDRRDSVAGSPAGQSAAACAGLVTGACPAEALA